MSWNKQIEAEPEQVFLLFTDIEKFPENLSGIERVELLTAGPVGVGTRFKETRIMFKRETTEEMEVTRFDPGKEVALGSKSCGSTFETSFKISPSGSGSSVDVTMECRPVTLFAKLMSPLSKLMAGSIRKLVDKDLEEMKAIAEQRRQAAI